MIRPEKGEPLFIFIRNKGGWFTLSPYGELLAFFDRLDDTAYPFGVIKFVSLPTGKSFVYKLSNDYGLSAAFWSSDETKFVISHSQNVRILTIQRNEVGEPASIVETNKIHYCGTVIKEECNYIEGGLALTADNQYLIAGNDYKLWVLRIDSLDGYLLPIE